MARERNTNSKGLPWSETEKKAVWEKGTANHGYDRKVYRKDKCGRWIKYEEFGLTGSEFGWEIDHIVPVAHGGGDEPDNLQPLFWEHNLKKGNSLTWNCR